MAIDLSQFASADPSPEVDAAPSTGQTDLAQFASTKQPDENPVFGGEFERGVERGVSQTKQMFLGLADMAGSVLESAPLREFAQDNIDREEARIERLVSDVPSLSDIDNGADFLDWAAGKIGEQIPIMGGILTGTGAGALAAGIGRATLRSSIRKELTNRATQAMQLGGTVDRAALRNIVSGQLNNPVTQQLLQQTMSVRQGATVGSVVAGTGINTGDIQNELREAGIDAPLTAAIGGVVAGALDAAPVAVLVNRMFPGVDKAVAHGFIVDVAKTMGLESIVEGSTEAAQELVVLASRAMHDPTFNPLSEENQLRILEAAAAGALVGSAMGAVGQAPVSAFKAGQETVVDTAPRLQTFVRGKADLANARVAAAEQKADSLIPGIQELRSAVTGYVDEAITPVLNSVRERASEGVSSVRDALGSSNLGINVNQFVTKAEANIQRRVAPVLDEALDLAHQQVTRARAAASNMIGEERQQFFTEQLQNIRASIDQFVENRIRPIVAKGEKDLAEEIQTNDHDDPDSYMDEEPDAAEVGPERDFTRVRIGAAEKITKTVRGSDGGVVNIPVKRRSRDDRAKPLSRSRADAIVNEIREAFPDLNEEAVFVEPKDDGFVVAIGDIGNAEEIFTQLRANDGVADATAAARGNPNVGRRIGIRKPGAEKFTRMDIPTLALAGQDMIERAGTKLPENMSKRSVRGLDEILGRLLDQGYEVENYHGLRNKILFESGGKPVTVGQARGRTQFAPDQEEEVDEDGNPIRDTGPIFDNTNLAPDQDTAGAEVGLGKQENVTATEESQNEASRRTVGAGKKSKAERVQEAEQWHRNSKKKVRVALGHVTQEVSDAVHDMVTELLGVAGLSNRVMVVDSLGAQTLIDEEHPISEHLIKAQQDNPNGRIFHFGEDKIIYLSDQILIDKRQGSESNARMNTMVVLAHEIGHMVERAYYRNLSPELKAQVYAAFEKSGFKAKNPNNRGKDFEEWMADQFVGWATRRQEPKNAVEDFFRTVASLLKRMFDLISKKFGLDETYGEFMDGVQAAAAGREGSANPFTQHFVKEGRAGYTYHSLPEVDDVNDFDAEIELENAKVTLKAQINKRLDQYPGLKQAAVRTWETTKWLHDSLTASLNGSLRSMGLPAANELADMFNRTPGDVFKNTTYFNGVQMNTSIFAKKFREILGTEKNPKMTATQKRDVAEQLIQGTPVSNEADAILKVFQEMYDYATEAGLPVEKIENYFPRIWDIEKMALPENYTAIVNRMVEEHGFSQEDAESTLDNMLGTGNESANQANMKDPLNDVPYEGFIEKRAEFLNDRWFNEFQSTDLDRTVERYLNSVIKRAEFNRYLGEDAWLYDEDGNRTKRKKKWNPRANLERILDEAREQGAEQKQLDRMVKAVDAMLGRHGKEIPAAARQTMAWIATYQNVRLLLFSTLASFPDIVGPAIRSGDFKTAYSTLKNNWKELVDKESDLNEMARTWGIISDSLNTHILTEHFDNHWVPERARRINESFFRAIGLERWTNFTRAAALAVGRDAIIRWAAAGDVNSLAELDLTPAEVRTWVDNGQRTHGGAAKTDAIDLRVAQALTTFVNESIMRPNPSQRPLWASNPAFMLLFHLKSFMYSFHDTVGRRIYHNFKEAGTPWQKAMVVAMPAAMMMALTGIGLELRELIQYKLWGKTARTDRMSGIDYTWELLQRSGLFGVSQLAMDWEGADERGQLPFMAISGPTLNQLNDFVAKPPSQTVPKAIPIVSQIPAWRQLVRDVTPL